LVYQAGRCASYLIVFPIVMRIFIHNVDTYLGKVLVNELRKADGGYHRIFGTVKQSADQAPKVVKRILSRDDLKRANKMIETIQSCKVVVVDLFNCTLEDIIFMMKALKVDATQSPPKQLGELESDITFVLISSAMVWADTKAAPESNGGVLRSEDFPQRKPRSGTKYEQWKEMEDLVLSGFNREGSTVKALVVGAGVLYGEGEDALGTFFKDAWCGDMNHHVILGSGTNRIPTVHSRDLARLVRHIMDNGNIVAAETPYFLAVDQPQTGEEGKSMPSTQAEIIKSIVDEMCDPFDVPHVEEWPKIDPEKDDVEALTYLQEVLSLDIVMEPCAQMFDPEAPVFGDLPPWGYKEGLVKNIRKIADEFCKERKLRCMKILIGGPPCSGKSTLGRNVAEHFRLPHHELPREGFEALVDTLSTRVCRYRGYALDAGLMGFAEVERLFRFDIEVTNDDDEEPPPPNEEEGEEPPPKQYTRQLYEEICPSYVVVLEAPRGLCEGRFRQARGADKIADFEKEMIIYSENNLVDGVHSLSDFFQELAKCSVLNIPVAGKDEEDIFESTRIYMEREGRPLNYLPSEEEVSQSLLAQRAERRAAQLLEQEAESERLVESSGGAWQAESRRQSERMAISSQHLKDHQQLKAIPLREYLMEYMIPTLTEGLIEVCKVLPDNPTDYLADYLENHSAGVNA